MTYKSFFPALSLVFLLSGCAAFLPKGEAPDRLYTLNAPKDIASGNSRAPHNLQILVPEINPGIDTEQIALRREDNRINYFAQAKWAAILPELTQSVIVESFNNSQQLKSVGSDLIVMRDSFQLLLEIRDFQAEYLQQNAPPSANVRVTAKLIKSPTNEIIFTRTYHKLEPASDNTLNDVVRAIDVANQHILRQIIADTANVLRNQPVIKSTALDY